jgi:CRISPR-associated protein Cas5h
MQYLVFNVRADLAQFKKPFTTMSPQTFGFPPGTTVIGMISAILGLDKEHYWQYFPENSYRLAIGIRKPIKKVVIPINTLKTTLPKHFSRFEEHKRTTMEFIKDGMFRIWFAWDNQEMFASLVNNIRNHESFYTVSLGLAWNLADYSYIGLFDGQTKMGDDQFVEIDSVIRKDILKEVQFEERVIYSTRIPVRMKTDGSRIVEQYSDYLFDNNGQSLWAQVKEYEEISNGERIVLL